MITDQETSSKTRLWISYVLQGLIVVPFIMGAFSNMFESESAVKMAVDMGYSTGSVMYLGIVLFLAVILYAVPKTCVLGASVITAWLGGAVATHIIHQDPMGQIFFPVIFGIIVWFVLWLRMPKLRALSPFVKG